MRMFVSTVAFMVSGCSLFWRSPAYYAEYDQRPLPAPIRTQEEYNAMHDSFVRPYIVEAASGTGAVLVFGATHTKDPRDRQLAVIDSVWAKFRPTAVLVEGRPGFAAIWSSDLVPKFGEMGYVYGLARRDDAAVWTWEPPFDLEVERMTEKYPAERVALFYVLRPYFGAVRFGRPADPEAFVLPFLEKRTKHPRLRGTIQTIADIDSLWKRDFSGLADWRETSDEYGWPGYLTDIAATSNAFRDEHCARILMDLAAKGHRVFVAAGSSHAVRLEPVVRGMSAGAR